MEMIPVKSEMMTHVGHDGSDLHVTYKGGKTYVHAGVPVANYEGLLQAQSKGAYLNTHISKGHPGKLLLKRF